MTPEQQAKSTPAAWMAHACLTPWRFALLLGVLIVACFPQVISGTETFFWRDYAVFGYPLASYHKEAFWNGEMPLWNPLNNCGLPFTAQWNTMTLYPLSLIYLLFPLSWSLGVFCLAHMLLAGLGMHHLAFRWTGSRLAASIAGVAFAFNGLTWDSLMWPNNIAAFGWMPWVVLAVERAWREGGRMIVLAGLAGAMQMLTGAPEVILQTWFLLGVLWLAQCFRGGVPFSKMVARPLCAGLLVGALAGAQLLPFLDLLAHSQRDTSFAAADWSMPPTGWANYLVPLFHCFSAGRGVYVQHDQFWTSSYFLGAAVVAFALLAVWRVRNRQVWLLAALALFSLTMALGDHGLLYPALRKIAPQIGFMRFPIKFVVLATFVLPLLAAHGFNWLATRNGADWPREWRSAKLLVGILLALMLAILVFAWKFPQPSDDLYMTIKSAAKGALFLVLIFGCVALLRQRPEPRVQFVLQAALVVMVWLEVFTHVPTLSPTVTRTVFDAGAIRSYLRLKGYLPSDSELQPGQSRAMPSRAALNKMYFGAVEQPVADVYGRRLSLFDDLNLLDNVPKLDGFYSLYLREMNNVLIRLYLSTNELSGLKDFLNISHGSNPTNALEWIARPSFSPLITGGQEPVFADNRAAVDSIFDPAFDGRRTVFLPPEAKPFAQTIHRADVKIAPAEFSAQRLGFAVEASQPALVVIAQTWYHPWHAYVDGAPTRLWRANYAFQALEVPAGQHQVRLAYEDNRFRAGVFISLTAMLISAVLWFAWREAPHPEANQQ